VIVANLPGAVQAKRRPGIVLSTVAYHAGHPDIIVGVITTNTATASTATDHILKDWQAASLLQPSAFRTYIGTPLQSDCRIIGHLSPRDWQAIQKAIRSAIDFGPYP